MLSKNIKDTKSKLEAEYYHLFASKIHLLSLFTYSMFFML